MRFKALDSMLVATSDSSKHFAGTIPRGLEFLTNGLSERGAALHRHYFLSQVSGTIRTVIDVGANSGDLLLALPDEVEEYLGVEPIEEEYQALEKNCHLRNFSQPLKIAASNSEGTLEFFVSTLGGDSSAIQPANGFTERRTVPAASMDSILRSGNLQKKFNTVDLLKVEAEGFEPEVLEGCIETIGRCRWVVVDGGPERGPNSETTIENCTNMLVGHGFELVALSLKRRPGVGLFRNTYINA